jgi:fucose permease
LAGKDDVARFASAFEFGVNYFLRSLLQTAGQLTAAAATSVAGYFATGLILGRLTGLLLARRFQVGGQARGLSCRRV